MTRSEPTAAARTAFVLGGGGKWGAVEVGMLQALTDAGIRADRVLGTSIGAINGAAYCADPTAEGLDRLERLWRDAAELRVFGGSLIGRARDLVRMRHALIDPAPLADLLRRTLPTERIEDLGVPFACVAACIERAAERWFDHGPLVEALMASSAVPGLFPPVEVDGEHHYDGGLVDSVPVSRAIAAGATTVYVLQVGRLEAPLRPPERIHETALIAFEIARRHRFATTMANLPSGVRVHVLPSANPVGFDDRRQLRFSSLGDASGLVASARAATEAYLDGEAHAADAGAAEQDERPGGDEGDAG
ncbi:MAG: patatin-like phospholipase family protein [Actinomycetota bacterium]|nr:patatin-like phospholipase family protein [Actinomycetota bacterium]